MEGKINKNHELMIKRGSQFFIQHCCYNEERICGTNCALFGEPQQFTVGYQIKDKDDDSVEEKTRLNLCRRPIVFNNFSDNRY